MMRSLTIILVLIVLTAVPLSCTPRGMKVGSKKFTESVILGEMARLLAEETGTPATHYRELGGTKLVFQALKNGDIDIYPEYTGTIAEEIIGTQAADSLASMQAVLQKVGIRISKPLGFNNTYAIGMMKSRADELGIEKISDLLRYPDLRLGFTNEFVDRKDGWRNLQKCYDLPQRKVVGLDHDLAYRQLALEAIDVIDVYTTDAKIGLYDLALLQDDRGYFPRYDAVMLYRADLSDRHPQAVTAMLRLQGIVSESEMMTANGRVELEPAESEARVAANFLKKELGVTVAVKEETMLERVRDRTAEHLDLVRKSLVPAILIAVPLGIVAAKRPRLGQFILAIVGIVQTIPALALLVMLMPLIAALGLVSVGLGSSTAIVSLLLYSLLPIVRNTHAGLSGISNNHYETALALGLPPRFRLMKIELPLASRSILAGIKTAAVINIGFATLGALIGAGGYGQPIIRGIRLNDTSLILQGAIPAAMLALLVQGGFEISERYLVPKGLRLERTH